MEVYVAQRKRASSQGHYSGAEVRDGANKFLRRLRGNGYRVVETEKQHG